MSIVYLITIIFGLAFQNIVKKPYTQKTKGKGNYFFSLLVTLSAMIFFVITSKGFKWNSGLIIYAVLFAVAYAIATIFTLYAILYGSLSLTSLIVSYSLILPTLYGLIFLNEPFGIKLCLGIVLLIISIFLINQKNSDIPISFRWVICVILAFVGNGMTSVVQKMQQVAFNSAYKNEFMIISLAIVTSLFSILVYRKDRYSIKKYTKAGWYLAVTCGVANGVVNLFVMILSNIMPISLMFPMISAGGIIITYVFSRFFYKEKLTKMQFVGFVTGIASVILMS